MTGMTHLEEWAEGDVWEVVVGTVPATLLVGLLPEVQELMLQLSHRTQVQDVVPGRAVVKVRVIHVGQQPDTRWGWDSLLEERLGIHEHWGHGNDHINATVL